MSGYNFIKNPLNGEKIQVFTESGAAIINTYQLGGSTASENLELDRGKSRNRQEANIRAKVRRLRTAARSKKLRASPTRHNSVSAKPQNAQELAIKRADTVHDSFMSRSRQHDTRLFDMDQTPRPKSPIVQDDNSRNGKYKRPDFGTSTTITPHKCCENTTRAIESLKTELAQITKTQESIVEFISKDLNTSHKVNPSVPYLDAEELALRETLADAPSCTLS